ncbi:hypothetical protein THAOC_17286 [Thalassiosira oceanica]|uniref:Uncharacterized protein n=1 Tax=Thalassiosira oceanica TaxID=159749 RepID=K0S7N5_THAOC|nr:hypothetical protein THAOC_17286 [Thalassiosira oceanica]|eukprot:EJK62118.1 hypothetical protein THAOC_17286 [Thalassiosira oceanica]
MSRGAHGASGDKAGDDDDGTSTTSPSNGGDSGSECDDDGVSVLSRGSGGDPLPLPPLKYARLARLAGSLPRDGGPEGGGPMSTAITASALGRVVSVPPSPDGAGDGGGGDELFFCVTFSDPRAVFGATTGSIFTILLGRLPSIRRRVHLVGPWPPSTSNNHRCTDDADNH